LLIRVQKPEAMFRRLFGTAQIEQLALDFYCASAEMLQARVVLHERGPLAGAMGASMSMAPRSSRRRTEVLWR